MSGMTDARSLELILECIDMAEDYAHHAHDEAREALDHIAARLRGDGEQGQAVACDCGSNTDNRQPHHDECAIYTRPQPSAAPVGVEGLMQLARNWCLAWGEWAHDADPGCAKENAAEAALRAALTQALSQQPAAVDGAVRVTGTHRYEESGRGWCKHCGYATHVAERHGAALGQEKGNGS